MLKPLKVALLVIAAASPALGWAQGKIAVVDLEKAMLQTDLAQKRLGELQGTAEFKTDKAEYDKLRGELEEMVKAFQKDSAVLSQEQQAAARQKLDAKRDDLEHVTGKLRKAEQTAGQMVLNEIGPRIEPVLLEIIAADGIGLLLKSAAVIHAEPSYDISAKVTEKLNQPAGK